MFCLDGCFDLSLEASESSQLKIVVDTKYFETRKKEDLYFLRFFHFRRNGCDLIELIKLQLKSPQAEQVVTVFYLFEVP